MKDKRVNIVKFIKAPAFMWELNAVKKLTFTLREGFILKTFFDIQQLLKRFGIFIYTGNRAADLELMEEEIHELYRMKMIEAQDYKMALLIIRKEHSYESSKRDRTI